MEDTGKLNYAVASDWGWRIRTNSGMLMVSSVL